MKIAAFFRNLNLGRPPAPTRLELERAFLSSGADSAEAFLTNGTLVFEAGTQSGATKVLEHACSLLQGNSGFQEPAFLRDLSYLSNMVNRRPFAAIDAATVYGFFVTFLHADLGLPPKPPCANTTNNVRVVEYTPLELLSAVHKTGASPGSPNAFAEKQFGLPATTRSWNTVCRLVQKHG